MVLENVNWKNLARQPSTFPKTHIVRFRARFQAHDPDFLWDLVVMADGRCMVETDPVPDLLPRNGWRVIYE